DSVRLRRKESSGKIAHLSRDAGFCSQSGGQCESQERNEREHGIVRHDRGLVERVVLINRLPRAHAELPEREPAPVPRPCHTYSEDRHWIIPERRLTDSLHGTGSDDTRSGYRTPISTTWTDPVHSRDSGVANPFFGATTVAVCCARIVAPSGRPVSASSPLG